MARSRDSVHYDLIFDRNFNVRERVIYLNSDIEVASLETVQKAFDEMDKEVDKPIRIEISSYGGSVYDMLGIVDRMRASPCHIVTRGFGKIMSAATFILAAGDERYIGANCWIMIHGMSDSMKGTLPEMKTEFEHSNNLENQMNKLYEKLSKGKTKASTFEKLGQRNHYLSAEEAIKLGLADKVIS